MKKLFPLSVIAALIVVGVLAYQIYKSTENEMARGFNQEQLLLARQAAYAIEIFVRTIQTELEWIASLPDIQGKDYGAMEDELKEVYDRTSGKIITVERIDVSGIIRSTYPVREVIANPAKDFYLSALNALEAHQAVISPVFKKGGTYFIALYVPIFTRDRFVGSVSSTLALDKITHILSGIKSSNSSYAWLLDDSGQLLYHPTHPEMILRNIFQETKFCFKCHESFAMEKEMVQGKEGTDQHIVAGKKVLVAYAPVRIGSRLWSVAVESPYQKVVELVAAIHRDIWLLVGFLLVLFTGFAYHLINVNRDKARAEERAKGAAQLKASEEKYRNLFNGAKDSIFIVEVADGSILDVNQEAIVLTGYSKEELLGLKIWDIHPPDKVETSKEFFQQIIKEGEGHCDDLPIQRKEKGVVLTEFTSKVIEYGDKRVIQSLVRDITIRKKAEKEIQEKNQELENFVHTVSHDIQAPLRAIEGFSDILLDDYRNILDAEGQHYLERIRKAARHMKELIDDLLKLSEIGIGKDRFEKVDVHQLVEEAKERLKYQIEQKKASIKIPDGLPAIYCNRSRMVQVFTNLIDNAIKFIPQNHIPLVEIGYNELAGEYEFYVRDNGIGIDERYYLKIFEIFQRLNKSEEYEGTGIGLTIVKKIIEKHGGKIWVESKEGRGSTFYFRLPKSSPGNNNTVQYLG
jgi:PAS domain S-box-containing protein